MPAEDSQAKAVSPSSGETLIPSIESGRYRHYRGNVYFVLGVGMQHESGERFVVYRRVKDRQLWIRPEKEFVARVRVQGELVPRFERLAKRA